MADTREYDKFSAEELAICLSHYDLGIIKGIAAFSRGSRNAPKAIINCERGRFLFKRRNKGVDEIKKVAFTHQIQLALAAQNFPLPHLLGTRDDDNSMLVYRDQIYEVQEFIEGTGYDASLESTEQSGHALGLYHKLLEGFQSDYEPPTASYHNAKAIYQSIHKSSASLTPTPDMRERTKETVKFLGDTYRQCVEEINKLGLADWPTQIVHGDWHPGNMLFRDKVVIAVIDYDTARQQQRVIDFANGALQFSIIGRRDAPLDDWPENLDMPRLKQFLHGYDSVNQIATDELRAAPYLMCEAMIAEAVLPIAATGGFGRFDGCAFLEMIRKKIVWLITNASALSGILNENVPEPVSVSTGIKLAPEHKPKT
jgi:Ser/Thr protein kinase RdoA (MazF antagonist)